MAAHRLWMWSLLLAAGLLPRPGLSAALEAQDRVMSQDVSRGVVPGLRGTVAAALLPVTGNGTDRRQHPPGQRDHAPGVTTQDHQAGGAHSVAAA